MMPRIFGASIVFLILGVGWALAATIPVEPGLSLRVGLEEGWALSREAPHFLVSALARHLAEEGAAQGKRGSPEMAQDAARKRLAGNEAFICNPSEDSCLTVDFSPLRPGESPPRENTLAASARLAGEALGDEKGISGLHQETRKFFVRGAQASFRVDAEFLEDGRPKKFVGVVGFAPPFWFYFYYLGNPENPDDFSALEKILASFDLERQEGKE
jgi:hypothetical protein